MTSPRPCSPGSLGNSPDRIWRASTVAAPSGHGFSNDTVMADAVVDGAELSLVVQAAPTGPGLFPEYPIERMASVQRDLRDHSDVPVANVRWFEGDPSVLGAPFYVMDRIAGLVPDESPTPYHSHGWVFEANEQQRRQMWTSLLEAMGRLHRVDVAAHFPYLTTTRWGMSLDADPAAERVRQWRDFTVWASETGNAPRLLMDAWDILANTAPARPPTLSICWGDAKLGNILFRDFEVAALLDWELCGVSAAEEDLTGFLAVDSVLATVSPTARVDGFPFPRRDAHGVSGHPAARTRRHRLVVRVRVGQNGCRSSPTPAALAAAGRYPRRRRHRGSQHRAPTARRGARTALTFMPPTTFTLIRTFEEKLLCPMNR